MLGLLAKAGLDFVVDMVKDKGEEVVKKVVKKTIGVDLEKKLSKEDVEKIKANKEVLLKEFELIMQDKQNARNMAKDIAINGKDWLVRNTGSMLALFVTVAVFALFGLLLGGKLSIENSNVAMIVGFAGGYVTQILSFYFGSSKNEADKLKGEI